MDWKWSALMISNCDLVVKRDEYARTDIPEYWIVEPRLRTVTVLVLEDGEYKRRGVFAAGEQAVSEVIEGFAVDVAALFVDA